VAYGDPVWNEVALVDDQDDLFMSFLLLDILQDGFTHGSNWISRIEYMKDDVRRVNDLVKLAVDTP